MFLIRCVPRKLVLIFFCFTLVGGAHAAQQTDFYTVKLPVVSKTLAARNKAIQQGFKQVLVKVSGHAKFVEYAEVVAELAHATDYLQQYHYTTQFDEEDESQLLLNVSFSPSKVEQFLQQFGQSVWQEQRPQLSIWPVIWHNGRRERVDEQLLTVLQEQAEMRGLPLVVPLFDLQEMAWLSLVDHTQQDTILLRRLAERYATSHALWIQLELASDDHWQSEWFLVSDNQQERLRFTDKDLAQLLQQGMEAVVEVLARIQSKQNVARQEQTILLAVEQVDNAATYRKTMDYLQGLAMVSNVQIVDAGPQQIIYRLTFNGDVQWLLQEIDARAVLRPVADHSNNDGSLHYRLVA